MLLVQGLVFNTESIINISFNQLSVAPLLKQFLYSENLTLLPTLH